VPRVARIVVPGAVHHLTQRGNNRQDVFFADDDRAAYLAFLAAQCRRYGVTLLGYCLMTNHVHVVAIPRTAHALAKAFGRAHWLYAQHINRLHRRSGHLWQNRFFSHAVDDQHAPLIMRYVEENPVRAGLCRVPSRYPWSSAAAHCAKAPNAPPKRSATAAKPAPHANLMLDLDAWRRLYPPGDWEAQLRSAGARDDDDDGDLHRIRRALHTGRPLASDAWVAQVEKTLGRKLRPGPIGRPKKPNGERTSKRRLQK
jgi:putative transposase